MANNSNLTQDRLRSILRYEPHSGQFLWLVAGAHRRKPGDQAGCPSKDGRVRIRIDNELYYRYRLAWLYMTGKWPARCIDHINGDHTDDRWINLRDVSQTINVQNLRGAKRCSKTGLLGVSPTREGKFSAEIRIPNGRLRLGTFTTAQEAHAAYMAAKRQHHAGNTL